MPAGSPLQLKVVASDCPIAGVAATGGSTNAALHLPAMAHEAGIRFTLDDVAAMFERTPLIGNLRPGGQYYAEDVHRAGGVPMIAKTAYAIACSPPEIPVWAIAAAAPTASRRFFGFAPASTAPAPAAFGAVNASIAPIHFGIVMTVNIAIGMFTPPFGLTLFVAQTVLGIPLDTLYRGVLPFAVVQIAALLIITYWPALSLVALRTF